MSPPGPTVIKLFESENELKCKNRLRDFIETLCLFSNISENSLKLFTISQYRFNYLTKFFYFQENRMTKSLRIFSSFMMVAPGRRRQVQLRIFSNLQHHFIVSHTSICGCFQVDLFCNFLHFYAFYHCFYLEKNVAWENVMVYD